MKLTVRSVDVNYVQQTWPLVKSYLEDALTKGNDFPEWAPCYNIDHVQQYVTAGQWLLLVAIDEQTQIHGACTVSFINYPLQRVAFITCIGGKLISNQETFNQLKLLLKAHGATKIQGMARPSIARLWKRYGFQERTTLVEVKI
jgi:hypothetical protein